MLSPKMKLPLKFFFFFYFTISLIYGVDKWKSGNLFNIVTLDKLHTSSFQYLLNGKKVELTIHKSRSISHPYGEEEKNFLLYSNRKNKLGEWIPDAEAMLPKDASRLLFILKKKANPSVKGQIYDIHVLKDDLNSFSQGSLRFINFCDQPTAFEIGKEKFIVNPESGHTISNPSENNLDVRVKAYQMIQTENQFTKKLVYINAWSQRENQRTDVLISKKKNKNVTIERIKQTINE